MTAADDETTANECDGLTADECDGMTVGEGDGMTVDECDGVADGMLDCDGDGLIDEGWVVDTATPDGTRSTGGEFPFGIDKMVVVGGMTMTERMVGFGRSLCSIGRAGAGEGSIG